MKQGSSGWKPWYGGKGAFFQQPKEKPLYTMSRSSDGNDFGVGTASDRSGIYFSTERDPGEFFGWKLYFPEKSKFYVYNILMFWSSFGSILIKN